MSRRTKKILFAIIISFAMLAVSIPTLASRPAIVQDKCDYHCYDCYMCDELDVALPEKCCDNHWAITHDYDASFDTLYPYGTIINTASWYYRGPLVIELSVIQRGEEDDELLMEMMTNELLVHIHNASDIWRQNIAIEREYHQNSQITASSDIMSSDTRAIVTIDVTFYPSFMLEVSTLSSDDVCDDELMEMKMDALLQLIPVLSDVWMPIMPLGSGYSQIPCPVTGRNCFGIATRRTETYHTTNSHCWEIRIMTIYQCDAHCGTTTGFSTRVSFGPSHSMATSSFTSIQHAAAHLHPTTCTLVTETIQRCSSCGFRHPGSSFSRSPFWCTSPNIQFSEPIDTDDE